MYIHKMKAMQDCMNVKSFNEINTYLCKVSQLYPTNVKKLLQSIGNRSNPLPRHVSGEIG